MRALFVFFLFSVMSLSQAFASGLWNVGDQYKYGRFNHYSAKSQIEIYTVAKISNGEAWLQTKDFGSSVFEIVYDEKTGRALRAYMDGVELKQSVGQPLISTEMTTITVPAGTFQVRHDTFEWHIGSGQVQNWTLAEPGKPEITIRTTQELSIGTPWREFVLESISKSAFVP